MSKETRLDKLENYLTPKQYMLRVVDEMHEYDSSDEYHVQHVIGKWQLTHNDFEKVIDGIKSRLKGQDKQRIDRAVSKAHKEGMFLYLLWVRAQSSYQAEHYRHAYNGLTLVNLWQQAQNKSLWELAKGQPATEEIMEASEEIREILDTFKARATRHLYHLFVERRTVEEIARRYFDGRELMFKQDRTALDAITQQALSIIKHADDVAAELVYLTDRDAFGEDGPPPLVDIEAIRAQVEQDLEQHVQYELDMARADLYSHLGELNQGHAIYTKYSQQVASGGLTRR